MLDVSSHSAALNDEISALLTTLLGDGTVKSSVGGELVAGDGEPRDLTNPATGLVFAQFRDASAGTVAAEAEAAIRAQVEWCAMTASQRGRIPFEIGRQIRAHAAPLSQLESLSTGRPIRDCGGEPVRMAEMVRVLCGLVRQALR